MKERQSWVGVCYVCFFVLFWVSSHVGLATQPLIILTCCVCSGMLARLPCALMALMMPWWPLARSAAVTMSGTMPASTPLGTCAAKVSTQFDSRRFLGGNLRDMSKWSQCARLCCRSLTHQKNTTTNPKPKTKTKENLGEGASWRNQVNNNLSSSSGQAADSPGSCLCPKILPAARCPPPPPPTSSQPCLLVLEVFFFFVVLFTLFSSRYSRQYTDSALYNTFSSRRR
jgi:hypothetical protein